MLQKKMPAIGGLSKPPARLRRLGFLLERLANQFHKRLAIQRLPLDQLRRRPLYHYSAKAHLVISLKPDRKTRGHKLHAIPAIKNA